MWKRVALAISVILVFVCSFSTVTPSASYRCALTFSRWQSLKTSCLDRHGWLGEFGNDESRQHHDPSGSYYVQRHGKLVAGQVHAGETESWFKIFWV